MVFQLPFFFMSGSQLNLSSKGGVNPKVYKVSPNPIVIHGVLQLYIRYTWSNIPWVSLRFLITPKLKWSYGPPTYVIDFCALYFCCIFFWGGVRPNSSSLNLRKKTLSRFGLALEFLMDDFKEVTWVFAVSQHLSITKFTTAIFGVKPGEQMEGSQWRVFWGYLKERFGAIRRFWSAHLRWAVISSQRLIWDEIRPGYIGFIIGQHKDLYQPTSSKMECHMRFFIKCSGEVCHVCNKHKKMSRREFYLFAIYYIFMFFFFEEILLYRIVLSQWFG